MEIEKIAEELREKIKGFILGEKIDVDELNSGLKIFFKNKTQQDIDKVNARDVRLFYSALDILKGEVTEVDKANLDYIYSEGKKGLRYLWKSISFEMPKGKKKFLDVLEGILKEFDADKKNRDSMEKFVKSVIKMYDDNATFGVEEYGITDKKKESFFYVEFYSMTNMSEANILLVTNKKNKNLLDLIPKDTGIWYSNLIFKK